ncbi:MAG: hypothetical protein B6247_06590 [Candidatus Parabeggiatoa sp. nov. 2]|nr:MAG: hypothetical protein B6247_06590 [Beggiatoa sp. 4572_84]
MALFTIGFLWAINQTKAYQFENMALKNRLPAGCKRYVVGLANEKARVRQQKVFTEATFSSWRRT